MAEDQPTLDRFYRELVESAHDLIWLADQDGVFTYVNPAWEEVLGYKPEEVIGHHFRMFQEEELVKQSVQLYVELLQGRAVKGIEATYRHRNGKLVHLSVNAHLVRDDLGRVAGTHGTARDVTVEREARDALNASEQSIRALLSNMAEGVALHEMVFDEAGHAVDYLIVDINESYERILTLRRAEVLGRRATDVYEVARAPFIDEYRSVVDSGEPRRFEGYFAPIDRHFVISVAPWGERGFASIFFDDTERKRSDENLARTLEDLRENTQALRASQQTGGLGTYRLDIAGGHWTSSVNLDEIFGIDAAYERTVEGWLNLVHPDWREEMDRYFANEVVGAKGEFNKEYMVVRQADQQQRWVHGLGKLTFDEKGAPAIMYGTIADVTERHRAEEERLALERQMQHGQKLESLGVLAGGIAHDFNNLLMAILGNADLALAEMSPLSPVREFVEEIETATRRAADLAHQMLAYAGKGNFVRERFSLNELVEEMAHLLGASISKKVALTFNLDAQVPVMEGDATQIRQVIMNLITNASEAIGDESGVITLATGARTCNRAYLDAGEVVSGFADLLSPLPEGDYLYVEVTDTGCGISDEALARIFDPFYTTKFTGRGLGLAAVMGIVRSHKGLIRAVSKLGGGTTFRVLFPAPGGSNLEVADQRPISDDEWQGEGAILVADDDDRVRAVARRMLVRLGFEVVEAQDGKQALDLFRDMPGRFCCILLDLTMPVMDGEQAFVAIRAIRADIPVVIVSGFDEQEIGHRLKDQRLDGFLHKPYQLADLRDSLRTLLNT